MNDPNYQSAGGWSPVSTLVIGVDVETDARQPRDPGSLLMP
jgi:hypothetical protein